MKKKSKRKGSRRKYRLTPYGIRMLLLIFVGAPVALCLLILLIAYVRESRVVVAPPPEATADAANVSAIPEMTPAPDTDAAETPATGTGGLRTPSPAEVANAVDGFLTTGDVAMRAAPSKTGAVLGKYEVDTPLSVYATEGDYCLVQAVAVGEYGYIASKFIAIQAPMRTSPAGTVAGAVSANMLAMRSTPSASSDKNRTGYLLKDSTVYIFFVTDEFYYVEANGVRGYVAAEFVVPAGDVPAGTPAPVT